MTDAIFVDTNVFVYARDAGEGAKQQSAVRWLDLLWREQRGRTSIQVLSEYYVTVTRKLRPGLPPEEAWDDVTSLLAWEPQPTDRELLETARNLERRYRLSWWDALIVAAAQRQNCSTLLTEDLQHGMEFGGVRVRDPFKATVEDTRPFYGQSSVLALRHRRPGRPPRVGSASGA